MKKLIITIGAIGISLTASAAERVFSDGELKYESLHITMTILTIIVFSVVILTFIKWILDYRLKNKLIEQGAPDHVVSQLLQPAITDNKDLTIKWCALLTGLGIGLLLVDYFQPLGIHSLAIMSLSLAASFLGYYIYLKYTKQ